MMRTTIRMHNELARQLKQLAASEDRTFTELIEEAAARLLADRRSKPPKKQSRIAIPVAGDPNHQVNEKELQKAIDSAGLEQIHQMVAGS